MEYPFKVTKVEPRPNHHLYVEFADGVRGELDLSAELFGPVFEPLKDPARFAEVTIDEFGAICWPCGADLAPDSVYRSLREDSAQARS